jgi:UDP-2-acetamido-3-amino-2,3-dideoxy-glucuronate N-acetyltransferase
MKIWEKQMSKKNIAVIGSGYWGKNLVRNYHQLGALGLICDNDESTLKSFKEQYPDVNTCLALSEALNQPQIEGVVIATPAETHYPIAREVLLAGKHLYVEKPLVLDESEAEELINLADRQRRTLMVGHLLHYHPAFIRLKEMIQSGELGRINYIYSNRLNLGKIRREENILWSFAPHDISMILALAGEFPENVYAIGGNYLHRKIADVTTTHLEFASGLRAHIFVSWLHPYKEQKLVVVGDRMMAVFNDTEPWPNKFVLYPHRIDWNQNIPVPNRAKAERVELEKTEPLKSECCHFIESFSNAGRPATDGREGLNVLRVLNAAQRSLDDNGCKVRLKAATASQSSGTQPLAFKSDSIPRTLSDKKSVNGFFVHETAVIDNNVTIGSESKIWHFSHILSGTIIGNNCNIGQNVVIGPDVTIGSNCKIQNNVSVYKGVTLEEGVFCGPSMVFTNIYNPRSEIRKMDHVRPTQVKHGATLGANCTIVCGSTIGRYAFIGAGAVVNKNIPDHSLVVGNPAKHIGWACKCGERLNNDLICSLCSKTFQKDGNGLTEVVD